MRVKYQKYALKTPFMDGKIVKIVKYALEKNKKYGLKTLLIFNL